jgi:pseudaminic acid synthase
LGSAYIGPQRREKASRAFRRSLVVVENMKTGELFNSTNVRSIRRANELHPRYLPQVLGKSCTRDITRGTPLEWDMVKTNN